MTADDIARDLMVNGLEDTIESALRDAALQGEALIQGKADELVKRFDNAYAEWKIACEEHGAFSNQAGEAYQRYGEECMALAPLFAAAVGSDEA